MSGRAAKLLRKFTEETLLENEGKVIVGSFAYSHLNRQIKKNYDKQTHIQKTIILHAIRSQNA